MTRGALLAVLAMSALTACGGATTTTVTKTTATPSNSTTSIPSTTSTTTTNAAAVYFQGAVGDAAQRPSTLQLTGDGTLAVTGVQWTSWGGPTATGSGNAEYHGCTPNCAQAPVHTALVSIRLFGIRACSGRDYYSGVNLTLNSGALLEQEFLQRSWSPC